MISQSSNLPSLGDLEKRREQMFPVLTDAQVARFAASGVEKTFDRGAILFDVGDSELPLYVVLEGELEIVHLRGADEDAVTVHHRHEFTGELSLLTDRPTLVRGRARGPKRGIEGPAVVHA